MLGAFSIGDWRVDPSLRTISGVTGEFHLEPKHMQVLVLLAEHAGQVVSKERIIQTVWAGTFVGDEVLSKAIFELRRTVDDDPKAPRFIQTIPKGGYRLVARVSFDQSHPGPQDAPVPLPPSPRVATRSVGTWWGLTASALLVVAVVSMAIGFRVAQQRPSLVSEAGPPMRVVPLTTLTGEEHHPIFSPDGEQVAFDWDGEKQDNRDIYVTLVGSSEVRRLTSDPLPDENPKWSPDGRRIAFLRERPDGTTIQLVSALGGPDGKLSDFRGADSLDFSPDNRWLAAGRSASVAGQPGGIYLIPADGGDPRRVIAPPKDRVVSEPAFSPDGRRLAYVSCSHGGGRAPTVDCDVYLTELDALPNPTGLPRRLTTQRSFVLNGVSWTRDGTDVVYSAILTGTTPYLWRVGVDGTRPPERLEIAGANAVAPATARSRDRVAFAHFSIDTDIYRVEAGRPAQLVVGSTFWESEPRLSPDGRRLVFMSQRAGGDVSDNIWLSEADGSNPRQLTHGPGRTQGSPSWSPDGRQIAFDSLGQDAHWHIWMIDADGGTPRRITPQADDEHTPTWSRDGRWIYFASAQGTGTRRNIWRVAPSGGTPEQLTHGGSGHFACESADGKSLLFQTPAGDSPLMAMPLAGGESRQLVGCVKNSAFGGPLGVYYVPCDPSLDPPVQVLDPATGRDRRFGTLDRLYSHPLGLSVSPDGRTIVYPRLIYQNSDLMLIENFR
jgi:Tol biopolymer transport system component/DNA-binding winged helix-turn-helix (wHTH) protein